MSRPPIAAVAVDLDDVSGVEVCLAKLVDPLAVVAPNGLTP